MPLISPTFDALLKYEGQPADGIHSFEGLGGAVHWVRLGLADAETFTRGELYQTSMYQSGVISAVGPLATGEVFKNSNPIFSTPNKQ